MTLNTKIVLASGSPRRRQLLSEAGFEFEVVPSDYTEDMSLPLPPEDLVKHLSAGKAQDVAGKVTRAIIVAADTIISFEDRVLGKPLNSEEAIRTLSELSGKTNYIFTGFTLINQVTGETISGYDSSSVTFRTMSVFEIKEYVASGEPLDKAGSYAIQGGAAKFISKIEGSESNIIGLPMEKVVPILNKWVR